MSTTRTCTREFRECAVGLLLSEGLSIRKAADGLGMPYWCAAQLPETPIWESRAPCTTP
jgi:hypothetical protein